MAWVAMILNCFLIVGKFSNGLAMISSCLWYQVDHAQYTYQVDRNLRDTFRVLYKIFFNTSAQSIVSERR